MSGVLELWRLLPLVTREGVRAPKPQFESEYVFKLINQGFEKKSLVS